MKVSDYHARVMELEGCQSTGSTREEALQNLQEAMAGWVETKLVNGYPIPAIFLKKQKVVKPNYAKEHPRNRVLFLLPERRKQMRTKLKDLKVKKVDFVDAGANQGANIVLYKRAEDGEPSPAKGGESKKSLAKRAIAAIAEVFGLSGTEAEEPLAKGQDAETFREKLAEAEMRKIVDEIWSCCYSLNESLCSILCDDEQQDKSAMMAQSVDEFAAYMRDALPKWASGTPAQIAKEAAPMTGGRMPFAEYARECLDALISKARGVPAPKKEEEESVQEGCAKPKPKKQTKGATEDMKIDKSKLTPEELAALEAIEKKAGLPEEPETPPAPAPAAPAEPAAPAPSAEPQAGPDDGDIYKGLHPAIKAELERLRKLADDAEEKELNDVAKKYELIGKKPDELVPLLKSLKAAGGDAYSQMIAVLDASVEAVEKSGIFSEIGKRGGNGEPDAWVTIEKHADEIMKAAPTMTRAQAIEKACDQHPELVYEYENNR